MASFTDDPRILGSFNPYIETLPAETLAQVGMIKQEEFNKGVEKVQGQVNYLSSLPIAKDEVKGYVQTKLGQLREGVTKNLAGDFSDQRIVNQIGGAAKMIASDPIVQNGVMSTARMQTSLGELQEAKKAGKSAPQNEAFLQNSISSWINDGQLDSSFNGSYTPYTDITDRFIKLYKEQNQGEDIPQDAYRTDANGNTVINPVLFKGKGPAKIQSIFNIVASQPDVQQQLQIDGWYRYRGVTADQLGTSIAKNTNESIRSMEGAIRSLQTKLAIGVSDTTISGQIEQLKRIAEEKKKSFTGLSALLHSNPDAAKTQLVKEELNSNLIGAYTFSVMEKSPLWETSMQQKVFDREFWEWQQTYLQNERKFEWDKIKDTETLRIAAEKAAKEGKIAGGNDAITTGQINSADIPTGSVKAYQDVQASLDEYTQSIFELTARTAHGGQDSPAILDNITGQYKLNFGPDKLYKTREAAMDAVSGILAQMKDAYINGGIGDASANNLMEKVNRKWDNYQSNSQIVTDVEKDFAPKLSEIRSKIGNEDYANAYIVEKKFPGWRGIESSLRYKYGADWKEGMGIGQRIYEGNRGEEKRDDRVNNGKYQAATSAIRGDETIPMALSQREESFLRRQSTGVPILVTHDVSKSEIREDINTRFNALARSRAVNPSTGKGDANTILELTGKGKDGKDNRGNLQYRSDINPQTGIAHIEVSDGTSSSTMEVSRTDFCRQFPERCVQSDFREEFGSRLNQTQWTSTDPLGESNGGGRANAYKVMLDKPDFPFVVQYHLVAQGPNQYAMRWWVTPKPTATDASPTPIINGEYASGTLIGMPTTLTEEEVVKWKDKLKDSNWLKGQLLYKFKPQAQAVQ